MADRWMDDRDRQMRERDWRRSEELARGRDVESRTWQGGGRTNWQGRDYRGVSPAMRQGEYDIDRGRPAPRTRGYADEPGYGDDIRSRTYLSPRGQDYESGYLGSQSQSPPEALGAYDEERLYAEGPDQDPDRGGERDSFMYRAGGRVASWFGRAHHDQPAQSHRGRGPSGYKRSDERINEDVHEKLTEDHYLDASAVIVAVSGGEVTLSGTVINREDKHRAEHLVERVSGVHHVQNNLRLAGSPSGSVLDAQAHGENPGAGPAPGRDKMS